MSFVPKQILPTRISPNDRFDDLLSAANVRLDQDPMFGGLDRVADHFQMEALTEPRVVPITLIALVRPYAASINDLRALELLAENGLDPISPHAFLALLGQHAEAGCVATGLTLPQPIQMNGYAGVLRFMYRKESKEKRILGFFPVRSVGRQGFSASFGEYELFAGEPIREAADVPTSEEC
ncbi:MAG: hypothetical protein QY323_02490 [Patescibacteria group bacterium]|nr:MAG: hypothetical protein QY323_02490 [Patescibacteria group bacterium]